MKKQNAFNCVYGEWGYFGESAAEELDPLPPMRKILHGCSKGQFSKIVAEENSPEWDLEASKICKNCEFLSRAKISGLLLNYRGR